MSWKNLRKLLLDIVAFQLCLLASASFSRWICIKMWNSYAQIAYKIALLRILGNVKIAVWRPENVNIVLQGKSTSTSAPKIF